MNNYNFGQYEPIILPAEDGGDKTNTFGVKVKKLFEELFSKLNSDFAEIDDTFLKRNGGVMTGPLKSQDILPTTADTYSLGSTSKPYKTVHALSLEIESSAGNVAYSLDSNGITPLAGSAINIGTASAPVGSITAQSITVPTATITKLITSGGVDGNASTASKLASPININGTSFDGSKAITTASWGTSRKVYVTDAWGTYSSEAVPVNGASDVRLKLPQVLKARFEGDLTGNVNGRATRATAADTANNSTQFGGYTCDFGTQNNGGTWLLVLNGGRVQHRTVDSLASSISTPFVMRPNYNVRIGIGNQSNFTAPTNGICYISLHYGTASINGWQVINSGNVDFNSKTERVFFTLPVSAGDTLYCTGLVWGVFVGVK